MDKYSKSAYVLGFLEYNGYSIRNYSDRQLEALYDTALNFSRVVNLTFDECLNNIMCVIEGKWN